MSRSVDTWPDLQREVSEMLDFHKAAVAVIEAICAAVRFRDPTALRLALREYRDLESPESFTVDRVLFE